MRPSLVRSKSAPQRSSSSTRSGDSWACSCAMRQLFSILPPRIVSRKCTCQLSSGHTLPMAAAMPPSAITVCALPSSDLQMRAVFAPCALASMAARSPAPPAPITLTSYSWVSYASLLAIRCPPERSGEGSARRVSSEEPQIADDAHGQEPHVHVSQPHREEADPGKQHV